MYEGIFFRGSPEIKYCRIILTVDLDILRDGVPSFLFGKDVGLFAPVRAGQPPVDDLDVDGREAELEQLGLVHGGIEDGVEADAIHALAAVAGPSLELFVRGQSSVDEEHVLFKPTDLLFILKTRVIIERN